MENSNKSIVFKGQNIEIQRNGNHYDSSILTYTSKDGSVELEVKFKDETVWLNRSQMATLFGRDYKTIAKHVSNALNEELEGEPVVAKFATPKNYGRVEGYTQSQEIEYYNLDMIMSVGFRVKSRRGVEFRKWAKDILKQYVIKGYAINRRQLDHYNELKDVVKLMSRAFQLQEKVNDVEYSGIVNVIGDYVYALDTLDRYDYQQLSIEKTTKDEPFRATYENAMEAISVLKEKFGGNALFANEKDDSFKSSIGQIYQTFDGADLYPSVEEKAAMLLYLVIKNHSFSDGNKRIAAMLFIWFMERNCILYSENGDKRIADNTLVALTLMIAESRVEEKEIMVKLVVNLINKENQ
ncbi:MAG: virulence protein RhuM/Fic/DOC family protein [Bacteroidales bacterium]|nr:virulence protein RhuM/Fic/DOC family protein [Bacteroidales bacterium]